MKEVVGLAMIGEGVIVLLRPRRYTQLWDSGPNWWRGLVRVWLRHPETTRIVGLVELMAGIFLALRETDK